MKNYELCAIFFLKEKNNFDRSSFVRKLLVFIFFVYRAADGAVEEAPRREAVKQHHGQQEMDYTLIISDN